MKRFFLGLFIILLFLPQMSFGQSVGVNSSQAAADQASIAYYKQQEQARAAWKKLHPDIVATQDQTSVAYYKQQEQIRAAYKKLHPDIVAAQDQASITYYKQQEQIRAAARLKAQNPLNAQSPTGTMGG